MTTPRRYELVVFDWDGTLFDSAAHIATSIQRLAADLALPVPSDIEARHIIGLGLQDAMEHLFPALKSADYPRVIERYRHHYFAGEEAVVLFDGVRPGLESLTARGHLLAVATGKSRRGLDQILETTGLGPLFHGTRCGDEGFPKPHPEMLEILLDTFGVGRDAALMIGDTTHDLEMAKAAGVDGLAVTYGAHDAAKLAAVAPLASVHTPAELWQWLERNG